MQDADISNVVRAESDVAIEKMLDTAGGFGRWHHLRAPTPIDDQPVIRMNRDTSHSSAVLDPSEPTTAVTPDTDGRDQTDPIDHLPIADGWHHALRTYEPEPKILDGAWTFPTIEPTE